MVTSPQKFLDEVSTRLNESSTDTSSKRITAFNIAARRVKSMRKWRWNKKKHDLALTANIKTYDLTSVISDYDPMFGVYEVYVAGAKMTPIKYERRTETTGDFYCLDPNLKNIIFTGTIAGTEDIDIWYYPRHTDATAAVTTLDPSIPEYMLGPIGLLMKAIVHGGKRQRHDERNTLLDFKEEIGEAILADASNKPKDLPDTIPTPLTYNRVKRTYTY